MMIEKKEFEKKFLLKKLPKIDYSHGPSIIEQYYENKTIENELVFFRAERQHNGLEQFFSIKKIKENSFNKISVENIGSNILVKNDFIKKYRNSQNKIAKLRYKYAYKEFVFEIDKFMNMDMVILEIKSDSNIEKISFPPEIEKNIIIEITDLDNFSNYNLSESMD